MDTLLFILKKLISAFIYPLFASILIILFGIIFLIRTRKSRLGLGLVCAGLLILVVPSLPVVERELTASLERQAGRYCDPGRLIGAGVKHIVVLAGNSATPAGTPADKWGCSVLREMEGIRLKQGMPDAKLVISAGSGPETASDPESASALAISVGIPASDIITETRPFDTADEARLISDIVGSESFALVTSAIHMPRSMMLFQKAGTNPIPCPCDFGNLKPLPLRNWFIPSAGALKGSTAAIHEYAGMAWAAWRPPPATREIEVGR